MNLIQEEIGWFCLLLNYQINELMDKEDDINKLSYFTLTGIVHYPQTMRFFNSVWDTLPDYALFYAFLVYVTLQVLDNLFKLWLPHNPTLHPKED